MNGALTVAFRDLRERRNMLLLSVALVLVPFMTAALPAARADRAGALGIMSMVLAVAFGFGTAIALGGSVVSGDLAQRRLSFYFARPLSSAAIWSGKALGAITASLLGFLLILTPALAVSSRTWGGMGVSPATFVGVGAAGILVTFLVAHFVSTSIRSRSALIAADLALAVATLFVAYHLVRPLMLGGSIRLTGTFLAILGGAMVVILAIAPVWQLARGRADIRRSHAAVSQAIWASMVVLLLVAGGYVAWLVTPSPSNLRVMADIHQSPGGAMTVVSGITDWRGDYQSSFLVDAESGDYTRLKSPIWWGEAWSRDGRVFAWAEILEVTPRLRLELRTRVTDSEQTVATNIPIVAGSRFALSEDGSRVAIAQDRKVEVHDLRQNRLLAAGPMPDGSAGSVRALYFVRPDLLRIVSHSRSSEMEILEFDLKRRALTVTGRLRTDTGYSPLAASGDGSRLLVRREPRIVDGRTGEEIAALPGRNLARASMLNDGRVAIFVKEKGQARLEVLSPEGVALHTIPLPGIDGGFVTGETADEKLIVLVTRKLSEAKARRDMLLVDLRSGTVARRVEGARGPMPQWNADPRLPRYRAGATFLAVQDDGKLITWNAATGERKPLPR